MAAKALSLMRTLGPLVTPPESSWRVIVPPEKSKAPLVPTWVPLSIAADPELIKEICKELVSAPVMSTVGLTARVNLISAATLAQFNMEEAKGRALGMSNPTVTAMRGSLTSPEGLRAFDIATAYCYGKSEDGPLQAAHRDLLADTYGGQGTAAGQRSAMGWNIGQAVQHGVTKVLAGNANNILLSGNPNIAAGQLVATGLANNGQTGDQKAATVAATLAVNPAAKAGVAQGIAVHKGFFARIADFFGL